MIKKQERKDLTPEINSEMLDQIYDNKESVNMTIKNNLNRNRNRKSFFVKFTIKPEILGINKNQGIYFYEGFKANIKELIC